jgi:hypothetical protein
MAHGWLERRPRELVLGEQRRLTDGALDEAFEATDGSALDEWPDARAGEMADRACEMHAPLQVRSEALAKIVERRVIALQNRREDLHL